MSNSKRDPQRVEVWEKYDKKCAYCGNPLEYEEMQIDHIHPIKRGGPNSKANYNPSCRSCNFYKSDDKLEYFRTRVSTMHKRLELIFIFKLAVKYGIITITKWDKKFYFERFK